MEWIQWSYLRVCLLQLYAYEYKCVTDLGPISLTGLLAPFAVHVHCHMIAYVSNVTVIDNVCCIQKDLRHQLLYYCWRPPRRSDDIRNMFFFISCDIEYSFSVTHVYLLFGVIYAMTCMYIYGNKAFEIEKLKLKKKKKKKSLIQILVWIRSNHKPLFEDGTTYWHKYALLGLNDLRKSIISVDCNKHRC